MLTGYLSTLPDDVLMNGGILVYEKSSVMTRIGVTDGGSVFDTGITEKDITFDGWRCRLKGLTYVSGWKPVITGKMKEFGDSTTGGQIGLMLPGSTEVDVAGPPIVNTITPKPAGVVYASAAYLTNLRWILECAGGGYACVLFPIARFDPTKLKITGKDKDEATIDFSIEAIGDPTEDLGTAPFLIERRSVLPT